jgi:lipopolysaccharide export system permease protein
MKLWERYFLKELSKLILLSLTCCYIIYSIMDYSLRSKLFTSSEMATGDLLIYYGWQFVTRFDLLLPLALMLSTIRVLTSLNVHSELVALLAGGLRIRRLMRPFFLTALFFTLLIYANYEWLYPIAATSIERFEDQYLHGSSGRKGSLNVIRLDDNSKLLYQHYDLSKQRLFDTFWVRSPDEIYRAKEIYPHATPPLGRYVDHLKRNGQGEYTCVNHNSELSFDEMAFNREDLFARLIPAVNLSLTKLWHLRPAPGQPSTDRDAQVETYLFKKLAMALLAMLVVLGPAPFCIQFGRRQPVFLIFGLSILCFVSFLTTMGAVEILGEEHVFSPAVVMWAPVILCLILLAWPMRRLLRE